MLEELQIAYSKDPQFQQYVDKYCAKYPRDITSQEALSHELVKQVYLSQKEESEKGEDKHGENDDRLRIF